MTQTALTREQVLAMEPMEVGLAVAEHIFKAKVIGKEGCPESRLLIGHFGYKAWQPLSGERWQNASWRNSVERAWLDCPRYGEDISAAWTVVKQVEREWAWEMKMHNVACEVDVRIGRKDYSSENVAEAICKASLLAVLDI